MTRSAPLLTPGQSRAYELHAAGLSTADVATVMDRSVYAVSALFVAGARRLGVSGRAAALRILRAEGGVAEHSRLPPLAETYNVVSEAYRAAPADTRDDLPIGALYRVVANDFLGDRA